MNLIDKVVSVFSPEKALKRVGARKRLDIINSGYSNYGASHTKKSLLGWLYHGGSANEDIHENLSTLRQRSRDLYAGVPLATSAIKTMRTNVVGTGLVLKSQIDYEYLGLTEEQAEQLENDIEREFALWANSEACDIERFDNFGELQQLAFMNWLLSGDVIALLPTTKRKGIPYDLRIRLIESDRLCAPLGKEYDPNFVGGVETNSDGEVVAYHILNIHPLSYETNEDPEWVRVEAFGARTGRRNVLHIMNRERIGQRRGVPFLAPVIESLKQLGRYTDAELVAAVVSGMFAVFIEKSDNSGDGAAVGEIIPENEQVSSAPNEIEIGNGSIIDLEEGEKAHDVSPGRPNANFDGFVTAITRQIGAALEIPYELLVKNFTASYSASRGALLEAWKSFSTYRNWLAKDFCQPVYEEWLAEAVAKGRIKAPGFFSDLAIRKAYCGAEWNGPAQGLLNPVQEVQAAEYRVNNGFSTRAREAREMNGSDFYKNARQRKREEALMKEVNGNAKSTVGNEQEADGQTNESDKPEQEQ
ncbi:MAG: phage portal protein [Oscillospiraceae bacterium]|nr:phage portal protein [Oscillospiraceae bacterium]